MALLLDDGRIVQDVKGKHMFLTTNEICTILDCSRGFVVKNFRDDLGMKFSDLRGETYKIREQIIAERGGEKASNFSQKFTDVFYRAPDLLNKILNDSELTIQTGFIDLACFFAGDDLKTLYSNVQKIQKRYQKPLTVARSEIFQESNAIIQKADNPILEEIGFYRLACINSAKRRDLERVILPKMPEKIRDGLDIYGLFSAHKLANFYGSKTLETLHRNVVDYAWMRIKFQGRVWYVKQLRPTGSYVIKSPATTVRMIQERRKKFGLKKAF